MKASIEIKDKVIIRRFSGEVSLDDMINSWKEIFNKIEDLSGYKGVITLFENVVMPGDPGNVNEMSDFLNKYSDRLKNLKVAIVLDHPVISNAVMVDHMVKHLQVRPFVTEEAAFRWIAP
ncbi:MAG: STAS/SEC14 domain-containing protein [Bacteroidales bacterium]|nr:STAS/SEC14 domain-containing protein [Bacteroidales bacterium]